MTPYQEDADRPRPMIMLPVKEVRSGGACWSITFLDGAWCSFRQVQRDGRWFTQLHTGERHPSRAAAEKHCRYKAFAEEVIG